MTADRSSTARTATPGRTSTTAINTYRPIYVEYRFVEGGVRVQQRSCSRSRATLLRLADENRRSRTASGCASIASRTCESLKQELYSEAPVYEDLEIVKLADSLSHWLETSAPNDPLVRRCSPASRRRSAPRSWCAARS